MSSREIFEPVSVMIEIEFQANFASWRERARELINKNIEPSRLTWVARDHLDRLDCLEQTLNLSLFKQSESVEICNSETASSPFTVSKDFLKLGEFVSCTRQPYRWDLLYRILYRLKNENSDLLRISVDSDIARAELLAKAIRRDVHKMHAFVRFKKAVIEGQETYLAWHKPDHFILEMTAPFFVRRFGDKPWVIFTPDRSAHWNGKELVYGDGIEQRDFSHADDFDEIWKTYYRSIFNPARLKIKTMRAEMPKRYWRSLPEASVIDELIRSAPARLQKMSLHQNRAATVPETKTLDELRMAALSCRSCPLAEIGSQVVFGHGAIDATLMIVGEQPGDQEDVQGLPFVGPAGEVLNRCLAYAGIDRNKVYLTNAVKHFKWKRSGKTRLHQKPSGAEMHACRPWLEAEIEKIKPKVILALGATAATSVLGRLPKISDERGKSQISSTYNCNVIISWHPSAILRSLDDRDRALKEKQLSADLSLAAQISGL